MSIDQTEARLNDDLQPLASTTELAGVVVLIEDSADRWAHWTAYMSMMIPGRVGVTTVPGEQDPYGPPPS